MAPAAGNVHLQETVGTSNARRTPGGNRVAPHSARFGKQGKYPMSLTDVVRNLDSGE